MSITQNFLGSHKICNERNLYTHSANQLVSRLSGIETARIASICKAFYRAILLKRFGLSSEQIKFRFSHDRSFAAYMEKYFGVTISSGSNLEGFDKAMWSFSEIVSK